MSFMHLISIRGDGRREQCLCLHYLKSRMSNSWATDFSLHVLYIISFSWKKLTDKMENFQKGFFSQRKGGLTSFWEWKTYCGFSWVWIEPPRVSCATVFCLSWKNVPLLLDCGKTQEVCPNGLVGNMLQRRTSPAISLLPVLMPVESTTHPFGFIRFFMLLGQTSQKQIDVYWLSYSDILHDVGQIFPRYVAQNTICTNSERFGSV